MNLLMICTEFMSIIITLIRIFFWINWLSLMSTSSRDDEGSFTDLFDPQKCARLHNQIVALVAAGPDGASDNIHKFFDAYPNADAEDPYIEYISPSLLEYLTAIDIAVPNPPNFIPLSFTPHLAMPHPKVFWTSREWDLEEEYPYMILLYPTLSDGGDGGLFFNMATNLCTWVFLENEMPHPEQWFSLELALTKYLTYFSTGKFRVSDYDPSALGCSMEPYVENDVVASLSAYDALLQAIASKAGGDAQISDMPLVDPEILTRWNIRGFAYEFLSRAKASSFTYIAPGIKPLDASTLTDLMNEDVDSIRQQTIQERDLGANGDSAPFPLFLGDERVELTAQNELWARFEAPLLLDSLSGVYVYPNNHFADGVRLITPFEVGGNGYVHDGNSPELDVSDTSRWKREGNAVLYQHGPCPFFGGHFTQLVTLLRMWTSSVESGFFSVGPDGVGGGMEVFKLADTAEYAEEFDVGACSLPETQAGQWKFVEGCDDNVVCLAPPSFEPSGCVTVDK